VRKASDTNPRAPAVFNSSTNTQTIAEGAITFKVLARSQIGFKKLVHFSTVNASSARILYCKFTADDIPKYISFTKASGEHGDRFVIEIPKLNISRKLSSSKKISIEDKFEEAKKILNEVYVSYPEINPATDDKLRVELNKSFEAILNNGC
jgi:hypothetical protein